MSGSQDSYLKAVRHALKSALSLNFSSQIDRQSYVKNQINRNTNEKVFITSNTNGVKIGIALKQSNYLSEIVNMEFPKFKTRIKNKCTIKERVPDPGYAIYFMITNIIETRKQEIEDCVMNLIEDIDGYSISEKPPISTSVKLYAYCEHSFAFLMMKSEQYVYKLLLIQFIIIILLICGIIIDLTEPLKK